MTAEKTSAARMPLFSSDKPESFDRAILCPICELENRVFRCQNDWWSGRDGLTTDNCPYTNCMTRERAVFRVLRSLWDKRSIRRLRVHEIAPSRLGLSRRLSEIVGKYTGTGYFPDRPFGSNVGHLRNEDAESQTFADGSFDLVVHLDVMEHLMEPFQALREIRRTLTPGGRCLFTTPTYPERLHTERVAFQSEEGQIETIGEPEYHGNPQSADGSLVTWRYGYDLPCLIYRETGFDVEVRRFHSPEDAVFGLMTEVYILTHET